VHEDVGNPAQLTSYRKAYVMGNLVRLADRHLRVNLQMQFNVILKSRIAGEQLFHSRSARNAERDLPDLAAPRLRLSDSVAASSCDSRPTRHA
jgi:hypothetical protein